MLVCWRIITYQKLKDGKISDQETIIKLQDKLIEKREEEISSVKSTVKTELKSYSSAVSKNCMAALSPKKIEAAVKKVADKEDRSRNVVIYGVQEESGEDIENGLNKFCRKWMKSRKSRTAAELESQDLKDVDQLSSRYLVMIMLDKS